MPYEVFNIFFRCSETHKAHCKLEDAVACFAQLTQAYGGDIPVHPISQKYVYEIAAVDRKGNQRNFSNPERLKADALNLDPRSVATDIPGITTFYRLAQLYLEASRLIPVSSISLKGVFDRRGKDRHFWTTDAGKGQALAFAQQAAFTLELSLKAYLEGLGRLASSNVGDLQKWQKHELIDLFNLLTDDEKKQLEEWWIHSDTKRIHFKGGFRDFLSSSNKVYMKWRYVTDLRSPNLSIDIQMLLSASEFLLSASERLFRTTAPFEFNVTTTTYPNTVDGGGRPIPPSAVAVVEGRVRAVRIPKGFDPFSIVELVIESDQHEADVTAQFYKRNVWDYYGFEGERVTLAGRIREDQPHVLLHPNHVDVSRRGPRYTCERRTLRGSIYDMRMVNSVFGGAQQVNLVLYDDTYFAQVECFFATDEERDMLKEAKLGDKILISGCVMLLNGQPMILVGPEHIANVLEEPDAVD